MAISGKFVYSKPKEIEVEGGRIKIFTDETIPPPENIINSNALAYMEGFNASPWDIYEWNITPERAKNELKKLVSTVLKTHGGFISLEICVAGNNNEELGNNESKWKPAGFCVVVDMGSLVQRLSEVERFKRLPKDFKSPKQYFGTLSKILGLPVSEFREISYMADIVVNAAYRGKGYGELIARESLEYSRNIGRKYALAWSVNPVSVRMLQKEGFKQIIGIGEMGEGIDFLVQGKVWYPSLDIPAKGRKTAKGNQIIAEHYIKKL